jgi:hypothetical protein
MQFGKKGLSLLCAGGIVAGLLGAPTPGAAQSKSVAEELIQILEADGKLSKSKADELRQRAKVENEARDAGVEAFRRDPVKAVKSDQDWLNRLSFSGDMRARWEGIYQENGRGINSRARNRERFRLRFGVKYKISDEIEGGLRLVSGDPNDPISANQTMDNLFTKKPINLDQAYITFTPKNSFSLLKDLEWAPFSMTVGKFANPLFRPRAGMVSEMVWDDDLNPEGANQTFTFYNATEGILRKLQLHVMEWSVKEVANHADAWMLGGQVVGNFALTPAMNLTLGVADYNYVKPRLMAQQLTNTSLKFTNGLLVRNAKGVQRIVAGGTPLTTANIPAGFTLRNFASGWNIFNVNGQLDINTGSPQWPVGLFFDYAQNVKAYNNEDTALFTGASVGVLKNPGDWMFSAVWGRFETESVLSMFSYSDYGRDGGTNITGPIAKIDYLLLPRLTLTVKNHFVSLIDRPRGQSNSMVNRLQLDALLAF